MRSGLIAALMTLGACGATFNGVAFENRGRLEQAGLQVQEIAGGWVRVTAPEGYSFIMPSAPSFEEETFHFGGAPVPQRFFEVSNEVNSRGFLVRVFDGRELDAAGRERLRAEAMQLFRVEGSEVLSRRSVRHAGLAIDVTSMDGLGMARTHVGVLHSFEENGFVWFLLAVYEEGYGGPGSAAEFFARAQ